MAEGQLPVGDDTLDELGDEFLDDLPDGALPDPRENAAPSAPVSAQPLPSGEPAAKKLCSEGQSSAAGTSGTASALPSAPPPVPRASSSGSSAATASASGRTPAPSAPRPALATRSRPVQPEPETDHAAAGAITGLAPHARYRNLRRHRTSVGAVLHALTRNTQSMVDVIFPEASSEEVRAAVLTRISALINGQAFNGVIPSFESAAGEALRLPRHTYSRHTFSWPSANDAIIFRSLFPVTVCLANNRAMEVKVFSDPNQEFTTARARGDTHVVLRNVPLGYSPERMRSTLLAGTTEAGLPWLFDLRLFHRLKDPYDDSAYSQLLGLPVAADGDAGFDRIPAVLWLPGQEDPVLLNISSHSCSVCSSNHRVNDHACFALTRRARLPNRHTISVAQLQSVNGRLIGQQPAPAAFKKDPGLLLIGIDLDVEVWTCSLCEFECGLALDSAMHHLASDAHRKHLQDSAHLPAVKEKYGAWRDEDSAPSASRLDRIHISKALAARLLDAAYYSVSKDVSDHNLAPSCSFQCDSPNIAPRPWRIPLAILKRPQLELTVRSACRSLPTTLSAADWDPWKLALCNQIKSFAGQEKIRVRKTISHLQTLTSQLRIHLAVNPTDLVAKERLRIASLQFERYEASRSAELALKAKLKVEGPREMGVSSLLVGVNNRIKASLIASLQSPSGSAITDLPGMSALCTSFFQQLYGGSQKVTPDPSFWSLVPPSQLSPEALSRLSLPFSPTEISKAIASLPKGKTPGPDGLSGELFRTFRTLFTPALHSLFLGTQDSLPQSMLQGRTVLIPKKSDATLVDNLRPITLMNTDYKVLAICLANRLQPLLPSLINHSQTAFIKTRRIGDTLNDTLDIFDWATAQSLPLLALTVDIRKAYDMVDRDFLFTCLSHLGLPATFIHWVKLMHSGTTTRISVNNFCGPSIPVITGVRQGCPLAPLLFLCVTEIFHRSTSCFLPGFPISRTQRRLMACYADDVTIFLNSDDELRVASHALLSFASISGEHLNWAKCSVIPFNFSPSAITRAGDIPIRSHSDFERILGDWVLLAEDMFSPPRKAFQVEDSPFDDWVYANVFEVDKTGRMGKEAVARQQLSTFNTVPIHVFDRWLGGSFCSGAGLAARLPLLADAASAGQGAPWSLLVGAAAKSIWNARCSFRYRQAVTKTGDALFQVLHYFLLAYKILIWKLSSGSKKKKLKAARVAKLAHSHRFLLFPEPDKPIIHPELRDTWLLNDVFHPP
ncbi:unnamed protein product [Closterium sp. NIES-65]|nr:unnamed protein product [Closterium sp. NIES-65]